MVSDANIAINIPTHARSRNNTPYFEHTQFIKYCQANKVAVNERTLEAYEKRRLLFPCVRLLYPRELLRRKFRAIYISHKGTYKVSEKWEPLIKLRNSIDNCSNWMSKTFNESLENGHPFEQHFSEDLQGFALNPQKQRFKAWKRYKVIIHDATGSKESKAVHYYAPWKMFFVQELNQQNTDTYNRATGTKRGWGIFSDRPSACSLDEFIPFFEKICFFSYRRNLFQLKLYRKANKTEADWKHADKKLGSVAKCYLKMFLYEKWIRFLRKLVEIHEKSRASEKILLSLEAKSFVARTVGFLRFTTGHEFQKICDDVSGQLKNSLSRGSEDGVDIYQGTLETLFMDEKGDLEKNVKWMLEENLNELNSTLIEQDRIPGSLYLQLFDELVDDPQGMALASIRKINKAYWDQELWREYDIWSGITDLAISIEDHGKAWTGKNKKLDGIFSKLFNSEDYSKLKQEARVNSDAKNAGEFIQKLNFLLKSKKITENRRCGKHLLITHLTRNFSAHNLGGSVYLPREERTGIYVALVRTLLVMYAQHKKQKIKKEKRGQIRY